MAAPARTRLVLAVASISTAVSLATATESPPPPNPALRDVRALFLVVEPRCAFREFDRAIEVIRRDAARRLRAAGLIILDEANPGKEGDQAGSLSIIVHCGRVEGSGSGVALSTFASSGEDEPSTGPFVFHVTAEFGKEVTLVTGKGASTRVGMIIWSHVWSDLGVEARRPFTKLREIALEVVDAFTVEVERARVAGGGAGPLDRHDR